MRKGVADRAMNGLALLLTVATVALIGVYTAIAIRPTSPLNPFPPPTPSPTLTPTPTELPAPTPSPTPRVAPSPTPIHPATLTPTQEPAFSFTATVKPGAVGTDCRRGLIVGTATDGDEKGLENYPLHLWGPGRDTVLFTDTRGRWQAELPAGAAGIWYVQLHAPDPEAVYPPLSAIIPIPLPAECPQATVHFRPVR